MAAAISSATTISIISPVFVPAAASAAVSSSIMGSTTASPALSASTASHGGLISNQMSKETQLCHIKAHRKIKQIFYFIFEWAEGVDQASMTLKTRTSFPGTGPPNSP